MLVELWEEGKKDRFDPSTMNRAGAAQFSIYPVHCGKET